MIASFLRSLYSIFTKRRVYGDVIITPAGRDELWLIEGDHKINVYIELSHGKFDRVIVFDSIKSWESPYEGEVLTQQKKEWVIGLVKKYLTDIGESYLVE